MRRFARLGAGEQMVGRPPVETDAVARRAIAIGIVEQLVEAGDPGRLEGLVGGE